MIRVVRPLTVLIVVAATAWGAIGAVTSANAASGSATFEFTGAPQTWTVPAGVASASFEVYGAAGGELGQPTYGRGGKVTASLSVTPGQVIQTNVGGNGGGSTGGWNGGGASPVQNFSHGGGASDVRVGPCAATASCGLDARLVVAGGGGGRSPNDAGVGGGGGFPSGGAGTGAGGPGDGGGGAGGTQDTGGPGGSGGAGPLGGTAGRGGDGAVGQGGDGGAAANAGVEGGGGGGGWYGGGGGGGGGGGWHVIGTSAGAGGAGGGGSSHGPAGSLFETGVRNGHGRVVVSWIVPEPTTTTVTSSASPSTFGQPVTFTATISPIPDGGTVQFKVDGTDRGDLVPVRLEGTASLEVSGLAVGTHMVLDTFSGTTAHLPSVGSVSHAVNAAEVSIAVGGRPSPSPYGQPVTFTASVSPVPDGGTVQFLVDGGPLGSPVPVDAGGAAEISTDTLPAGNHSVTAEFSGSPNYQPATATFTHTVGPAATSTAIEASVSPSSYGQPVTFTATVRCPTAARCSSSSTGSTSRPQ